MLLCTFCPAEDLPRWTKKFLVSYLHGRMSPDPTRRTPYQLSMLHLATANPGAPNQPAVEKTRLTVQLTVGMLYILSRCTFRAKCVTGWCIACQRFATELCVIPVSHWQRWTTKHSATDMMGKQLDSSTTWSQGYLVQSLQTM